MRTIKQKGVSLIELLIAMLVSSIILIAIMNLYVSFGGSSRDKKALATAQDQANFALNELARQVRMSGAGLCAKPSGDKLQMNPRFDKVANNLYKNIPLLTKAGNVSVFDDIRLRSYPNPKKADIGGTLPVASGSDALLVSYSSPLTLRITDVYPSKATRTVAEDMALSRFDDLAISSPLNTIVKADDGSGDATNKWLMISDCDYTEVTYYPMLTKSQLNTSVLPVPQSIPSRPEGFKRKYYHNGQVALVAPLVSKLYYVAEGTNGWALYEKDLLADTGTAAIDVMNGVKSMKVEYLYDDGSGTNWHPQKTDWSTSIPVRITLTMEEGGDTGEERTFTRLIDPRN